MLKELGLESAAPLSITNLLLNLAVGVLLSLVLRWHFKKYGSTLSNREEFAQVFPFILLTTILIITVVKSSLALSLGLVGALSIVRFRTPIKEPEELAYLFIAIAMGLGLGASQTLPTAVAGLAILAVMALLRMKKTEIAPKNLYFSVDSANLSKEAQDGFVEKITEILVKHVNTCDLRRYDVRENNVEITYFIDISGIDNLSALSDELKRTYPELGITFLDQNQLPSL